MKIANNGNKSNDIEIIKEEDILSSAYFRPKRIFFKQKGIQKNWDIIKSLNSVSSLIYNKDKDSFVFVKQFRASLYINNNESGFCYELCAGLMDKNKTRKQTIQEEIKEECGYEIDIENIQYITKVFSSVGISGSRQDIFYAPVSNKDKKSQGGGVDIEDIEPIYIKRERIDDFLYDESLPKTPSIFVALHWFFKNKIYDKF